MSDIQKKLNDARRDLLDLGIRNALLNFRHLKSKGLEIVDELPSEVYRILVTDGKWMSFLAVPESAVSDEAEDIDCESLFAQPEEDDNSGIAARHTDTKLQTKPLRSVAASRGQGAISRRDRVAANRIAAGLSGAACS